ncbi:MAG: septation protein IspZ [Sphingomonas bacterium]|nr:septation protein IspZ [Sphingomonas bacterium]
MTDQPKKVSGLVTFAVDFGPLLIFFLTYKFAGNGIPGMVTATLVFMVAIVVAVGIGHFVLGRVSPMLWMSAVLILFFGGITIYLHDAKFIQMKPTIIYVLFGAALLIGLARGKALLRWLFGPIFPGLNDDGWMKLSRNWGIFFLVLAGANEVMRQTLSFDTWLTVKVWGMTIVSMLFALANMPMLLRHGLDPESEVDAVEKTPVE